MTRKSSKVRARLARRGHVLNETATPRSASAPESVNAVLQRPLHIALTVFDGLASTFAEEGTPVRGALAQRHHARALPAPTSASAPENEEGELLVGRFEIPTTGNDGRRFPHETLSAILRDLYAEMGGATFFETLGIWRADDGAFYLDLSLGVEVWTRSPERLAAFVECVARTLDQEAIPLRFTRPDVRWITPTRGAP